MTPAALTLVLVAAALHATWNYWAKRAGGGLPFVYLVGILINLGYLPVVAVYCWIQQPKFPLTAAGAIFVSGILKTCYSLCLQRGYRTGDFSLVYPLARGTGPLLSAVGAILLFGERPSAGAFVGILAIVIGIFWLAGGHQWLHFAYTRASGGTPVENPVTRSALYGLLTGVFIAAYTLWDKRGVGHLMIAPILFDAGTAFTQLVLLAPFGWRRRAEVAREWREHRKNALIMAVVSPIGYVLVLTAMQFTPVSYVAPAREISILFGMFFGARFLQEGEAKRRLWAALLMLGGMSALALM